MIILILTLKASLVIAAALLLLAVLPRSYSRVRPTLLSATIAALILIPVIDLTLPRGPSRTWPFDFQNPSLNSIAARLQSDLPVEGAIQVSASLPPAGHAESPLDLVARSLPWIWFLGLLVLGSRQMAALWRLRRLDSGAAPLSDADWLESMAALQAKLGIRGTIKLKRSSSTQSPMTFGFFKPRILLPMEALGWKSERKEIVLSHELAHIARQDWLWQQLARLTGAAYWLSPFAWILVREHRALCEQACDAAVIKAGADPFAYASELVSMASSNRAGRCMADRLAVVSILNRFPLESRLEAIHMGQAMPVGQRLLPKLSPVSLLLFALGTALAIPASPRLGDALQSSPSKGMQIPDSAWMELRSELEDGRGTHMRLWGRFRIAGGDLTHLDPGDLCIIEEAEAGTWRHRFAMRLQSGSRRLEYYEDGVELLVGRGERRRWQELLSSVTMAQVHSAPLEIAKARTP